MNDKHQTTLSPKDLEKKVRRDDDLPDGAVSWCKSKYDDKNILG